MSRRGEITVECDSKHCHAEEVLKAADLSDTEDALDLFLRDVGWQSKAGKDICPQCVEEGKA